MPGSRSALAPLAVVLGLSTALADPLRAQTPEIAACYRLPAATEPTRVGSLTVSGDGEIALTLPGAPQVRFVFACPLDAEGRARCEVACDGGAVTLRASDGGLSAAFDRLRFDTGRIEGLGHSLVQVEPDGLGFTGDYRLEAAPPEACAGVAPARNALMEPGDFSPAVARIETYLAEAGYLAEPPDWYYTRATAAAVAAFQTGIGLPATGKTDAALLRRLGLAASQALGGC